MARRRPLILLCVLAGCSSTTDGAGLPTPTAPPVTRFNYGAGRTSYLVTSHRTIEQEIQGETQRVSTALRYGITTETRPGEEQYRADFVVDTVMEASGQGFVGSAPAQVAGTRFSAALDPGGRLATVAGGDSTSQLALQIKHAVQRFFPLIPPTGAEPETGWVDTVEVTQFNGSGHITTSAVITSHAGPWEERNSERRMTITWTSRYTLAGAGEQFGQPFTMEGDGHRVGQHYLAANGSYLGSVSADTSSAEVLLTSLGIPIPLHQNGADTVRTRP